MKKMGKVVAVLAGLSMMLTGVGTAYADDAAGDAAVSQSQTATADAQAAQSQADAANADQNAKQSAKTPAPANVDPQSKAAPKAQAKAAAADSAQISKVVAPSTALKYGVYYSEDTKPVFKVTLTNLVPGKVYGVLPDVNTGGYLPAVGAYGYANGSNSAVFTASSETQTVNVFYLGESKPSATAAFALIEGYPGSGSDSMGVEGTVINIFSGVKVKVLDLNALGDSAVTLDSQSVEDVGEHTVGLKAHYTINPKVVGSVAKICYNTRVTRIFGVNGTFNDADWPFGRTKRSAASNRSYRSAWDCSTGSISDEDSEISKIFTVYNLASFFGNDAPSQTIIGQWFTHAKTVTAEKGKLIPAEGEIINVVPGLLANTKYGNWGYDLDVADENVIYNTAKSQTTQADPASVLYSGITLIFDDGSRLVPNAYNNPSALKTVKDFTTKPATNGPVSSDDLTDANKNGVEGADSNKANAGSVYRLYIDSLKESATCKALVEKGSYCYWTGYIYSTPKQLDSADGKSSAVRVDKDGKAYVEFNIPADTVNGDHKIALYDNDGKLLGWTPVTVAEGQEPAPQPEKPSAEDVAALQSAIKDAESKKQADYTAESWVPFAAALKAAQDVAAKSDATKVEVTAATAKLAEASKNLVKAGSTTPTQPEKPSAEDVAALQSAIKDAEAKKQADYTTESWAPFAAALKAAQDVAAKADATKAEVTAATAKLAEASKNLVKAGSTTPTKPDKPTKPTTPNKPNKDNNKNQQKLPITGSSVLVIAFVAIALVAAGVSVVVYRRRNA